MCARMCEQDYHPETCEVLLVASNMWCSSGLNTGADTIQDLHEWPRQQGGVHTQPTYR